KKKLTNYFHDIEKSGKRLFVPYIVAGDGELSMLHERIKLLEKAGVAAIELGIPFSDPVADGPTFQEASKRALVNGTTLRSVLEELTKHQADRNVPIILIHYINPVFAFCIVCFSKVCVIC